MTGPRGAWMITSGCRGVERLDARVRAHEPGRADPLVAAERVARLVDALVGAQGRVALEGRRRSSCRSCALAAAPGRFGDRPEPHPALQAVRGAPCPGSSCSAAIWWLMRPERPLRRARADHRDARRWRAPGTRARRSARAHRPAAGPRCRSGTPSARRPRSTPVGPWIETFVMRATCRSARL